MLGLLIAPSALYAQTETDDPCLRDEQCQALVARAQAASQAKHYEDALKGYLAAQSLSSAPWLFVNIGRMQQKLDRPAEAAKNYHAYLATPPQPGDEEQRSAAQTYLREVEGKSGAPAAATPLYKKWWLWTIVGGVVVGATIGIAVGVTTRNQGPDTSGLQLYMPSF